MMANNDPPWRGRKRDAKLWSGQVRPRIRSIIFDKQWFFVLAISAVFVWLTFDGSAARLAVKDVATAQISLAALSFGACVTSLVLSLTLNRERAEGWALSPSSASGFSALSQLVFVFCWSALSQLAVIVSAFLALVIGSKSYVYVPHESVGHRILVVLDIVVASYAFLQLLSVIRSLVQIGYVTIADITEQAHRQQSTENP